MIKKLKHRKNIEVRIDTDNRCLTKHEMSSYKTRDKFIRKSFKAPVMIEHWRIRKPSAGFLGLARELMRADNYTS